MNKMMMIACVALFAACSQQLEDNKTAEVSLDNDRSRLSYAMGLDAASKAVNKAKYYVVDLERDALLAGITDTVFGAGVRLTQQEHDKVLNKFSGKRAERIAEKIEANKVNAERFLAEYAAKEGVNITGSGLHYEVVRRGDGPKPKLGDTLKVVYSGSLSDGTIFDPWHKKDKPKVMKIDQYIPGLKEGLQLMNVGSIYKFVVPPSLAYGKKGGGGNIPPYSVMVLEFELLEIVKDDSAGEGDAG